MISERVRVHQVQVAHKDEERDQEDHRREHVAQQHAIEEAVLAREAKAREGVGGGNRHDDADDRGGGGDPEAVEHVAQEAPADIVVRIEQQRKLFSVGLSGIHLSGNSDAHRPAIRCRIPPGGSGR